MRKIAIAVAIIASAAFLGYLAYDAGKSDAYAIEHDCSWVYDKAGFRGPCLPNN